MITETDYGKVTPSMVNSYPPTLNDLVLAVHTLAKEKGWWEDPGKTERIEARATLHMLMVTELAEATESLRSNEPPIWQWDTTTFGKVILPDDPAWNVLEKPEGELTELADVVIRIMDYCGAMGWDLENAILLKHRFNKTRSIRHGGKAF